MKIEHIAIWVKDLELMRSFYIKYFGAKSGSRYTNPKNGFSSYFLSFEDGTRIEIMNRDDISKSQERKNMTYGFTHMAVSVGVKEDVDKLTNILRSDGYKIAGEPRTTGDGFYESVILDPEGNHIELTEQLK